MDIVGKLNSLFLKQDSAKGRRYLDELERYKRVARSYSLMEGTVSVLSDMHANVSYLYYGGFAKTLNLKRPGTEESIASIWEENILGLIPREDLYDKYLQELRFFNFVKRLPRERRQHYCLVSKLRMRSPSGDCLWVCHRMFYVPDPFNNSLWLALCLYGPLSFDWPGGGHLVDTVTGAVVELGARGESKILSDREIQVLRLIDKGLISKQIADTLSISIHTVSRHRQEILAKLQVRNSIEACRVAKDLGLL
ncbi:helix-turn-helix transcriptional regulator [Barnesiella sp. An22]|uniref:response regulator transcription factor n=1 Tax=Barnesiella sp. An22 TaxID=1965590 RepID=UPI00320865E2